MDTFKDNAVTVFYPDNFVCGRARSAGCMKGTRPVEFALHGRPFDPGVEEFENPIRRLAFTVESEDVGGKTRGNAGIR